MNLNEGHLISTSHVINGLAIKHLVCISEPYNIVFRSLVIHEKSFPRRSRVHSLGRNKYKSREVNRFNFFDYYRPRIFSRAARRTPARFHFTGFASRLSKTRAGRVRSRTHTQVRRRCSLEGDVPAFIFTHAHAVVTRVRPDSLINRYNRQGSTTSNGAVAARRDV